MPSLARELHFIGLWSINGEVKTAKRTDLFSNPTIYLLSGHSVTASDNRYNYRFIRSRVDGRVGDRGVKRSRHQGEDRGIATENRKNSGSKENDEDAINEKETAAGPREITRKPRKAENGARDTRTRTNPRSLFGV
ncbi:uncharacterized protein LOC112452193 [Temnothorax curvispinosus]|uniref:Uncharacterized protein LOC112452193 n=1 Tax=Temnothorax curvispinosus TaxID=300111 RepID=A0A6J1PF42_9HYME|nr:uncharacterized protein LOC112452193 [Temnothorax curvispinosus]